MNKILVQDSYKVMFYSLASYQDGHISIDLTNWINIPKDTFKIFTTPEEITLKQGDSKVIGLQIVSSSGQISTITDLYDFQNYSSINIDLLEPEKNSTDSSIDIYGTEPIQLKINVPKNAKVGNHVIPLSANISFGSIFPSNFVDFENKYPIKIDTQDYELKSGNFTINVIEPLSFQEELKIFWAAYGSIISLVGTGFAGGMSSLFFESIKDKRKRSRELKDKYNN